MQDTYNATMAAILNVKESNVSNYWKKNFFLKYLLNAKKHYLIRFQLLLTLLYLIALLICKFEGTIIIAGPNKGYLEDYPFLSCYIVLPLILLSLDKYLTRFENLLKLLPSLYKPVANEEKNSTNNKKLLATINGIRNYVSLNDSLSRRHHRYFLIIFFIFECCFQIIIPTFFPQNTLAWTIDPRNYLWGYIFGLVLNFIVFVVVLSNVAWYGYATSRKIYPLIKDYANKELLVTYPITPDGKRGLDILGNLAFALILTMSNFLIFGTAWFLSYGINMPFFIGLIIYSIILIVTFLYPLLSTHRAMKKIKLAELERFGTLFQEAYRKFSKSTKSQKADLNNSNKEFLEDITILSHIEMLYNQAESLPVWPVSAKTSGKFFTIILFPLIFAIIQMGLYSELSAWIQKLFH